MSDCRKNEVQPPQQSGRKSPTDPSPNWEAVPGSRDMTDSHSRSVTVPQPSRYEAIKQALQRLEKEFPQFRATDYKPSPEEAGAYGEYHHLKSEESQAVYAEIFQQLEASSKKASKETDRILTRMDLLPAIDQNQSSRVKATAQPQQRPQLTNREKKIWVVIQQGTNGLQYCRELGKIGVAPKRKGVWKDGPGSYVSAYQKGKPWRHRIQDEKSKIRRKAKLAGLASE